VVVPTAHPLALAMWRGVLQEFSFSVSLPPHVVGASDVRIFCPQKVRFFVLSL